MILMIFIYRLSMLFYFERFIKYFRKILYSSDEDCICILFILFWFDEKILGFSKCNMSGKSILLKIVVYFLGLVVVNLVDSNVC